MTQIAEFEDGERQAYADDTAGSGGRGQVLPSLDGWHVLKLFQDRDDQTRLETPESAPNHLNILRQVTTRFNFVQRHPYWSALFSWPDKVALRLGNRRLLGVRMARVNLPNVQWTLEGFYGQYGIMRPEQRGWWIGRVAIAMKLARAIAFLEANTLAHTDISPKNLLAHPYTGDSVLIDCDGVVAPGTILKAEVAGTPEYMAPELVNGAVRAPDGYSDRHALGVVIYRSLLYRNPLQGPMRHPGLASGRQISPEEEDRYLWGEGALYIAHPTDWRNRPHDAGEVFDTAVLGPRLDGLFRRAFIEDLHPSPYKMGNRPSAREWEEALIRLYDRIVPCSNPQCAQRFFPMPPQPTVQARCFLCKQEATGPRSVPYVRLQRIVTDGAGQLVYDATDDYIVVGWPGRFLHTWHQRTDILPEPTQHYQYDPTPIGRFEYDQASDQWYLVNEGMEHLFVSGLGEIPVGQSVALTDGQHFWLDSSLKTRLATVTMRRLRVGHVYALPELDLASNRPWPTFRPTPADCNWSLGQPITLRADSPLNLDPITPRGIAAKRQTDRLTAALAASHQAALMQYLPDAQAQRRNRIIAMLGALSLLGALLGLLVGALFSFARHPNFLLVAVGIGVVIGWIACIPLLQRVPTAQALAESALRIEEDAKEEEQLLQLIESM